MGSARQSCKHFTQTDTPKKIRAADGTTEGYGEARHVTESPTHGPHPTSTHHKKGKPYIKEALLLCGTMMGTPPASNLYWAPTMPSFPSDLLPHGWSTRLVHLLQDELLGKVYCLGHASHGHLQ